MSSDLATLLNVDDIESAAKKNLSNAAWAYYFSAADDKLTKSLNNEAYRSILMRPRVMIDVRNCDTSTSFLGQPVKVPFFVSPAALACLAHESGEQGIAQACARAGVMQIISNNASMNPEQIVKDSPEGQIFGFQLYGQIDKKKSEDMLHRVNRLSHRIKFICLTVDAPVPGKREDDERVKHAESDVARMSDFQEKKEQHAQPAPSLRGGIGATLFAGTDPSLTWKETLPWLAKCTDLPIVLKGIQTHEDAYLASLHAPQILSLIHI